MQQASSQQLAFIKATGLDITEHAQALAGVAPQQAVGAAEPSIDIWPCNAKAFCVAISIPKRMGAMGFGGFEWAMLAQVAKQYKVPQRKLGELLPLVQAAEQAYATHVAQSISKTSASE